MNRFNKIWLWTILLPLIAFGCRSTASSSKTSLDEPANTDQSLLWKIEGNGLKKPSYLYGTIHIIGQGDFEIGNRLRQIINDVDVIAFEIDLKDPAMLKVALQSMLPGNMTIEDIMTPEEYDLLMTFMKDSLQISSMEMMAYKKMKPIFLSQALIMKMFDEPPVSYEMEFMNIADSTDKKIVGLESAAYQMSVLDSIPLEVQVNMLLKGLDEFGSYESLFREMVDLYKAQQIDSLYALMNEDYPEMMEYETMLLQTRNSNWVPAMESLMGKEEVLFAVGAAHLPGEEGVINLLKKQGFELTPLLTK